MNDKIIIIIMLTSTDEIQLFETNGAKVHLSLINKLS